MASFLGTEACMARINVANGAHALTCALFGCLLPGEQLLVATGDPLPPKTSMITGPHESLQHWGVGVSTVPLCTDGSVDVHSVLELAAELQPDAVVIQRGPGLDCALGASAPRRMLHMRELTALVHKLRARCAQCRIVIDNEGAELLEAQEPGSIEGVDVVCGALAGNLGAGVMQQGGYVAGKQVLVERACARASAPGLSLDAGSVSGDTLRTMFQSAPCCPAE